MDMCLEAERHPWGKGFQELIVTRDYGISGAQEEDPREAQAEEDGLDSGIGAVH